MGRVRASVVVPVYNEERNVRLLLASLSAQRLSGNDEICEIIVVASGCTDRSHDEVQRAAEHDRRIRLLVQDVRLGKAAAINAYIRERDPTADVTILCSADILLQPGCLEMLLRPLRERPEVGMTGARVVPQNPRGTLVGDIVHYLWDLHDARARQSPKLGELVAARAKLLGPIDEATPVDEASIEAHITSCGLSLEYVPEAVVANRGQSTLREYFRQRRRIAAGHFYVRSRTGYEVATLDWRKLVPLALSRLTLANARADGAQLAAIAIEAVARAAGYLDVRRRYSHAIWESVETAHEAIDPEKVVVLPSPPEPAAKKPGRTGSGQGE
jgi:biofilm PGA synthesis N-glycosyltransferase PgaC